MKIGFHTTIAHKTLASGIPDARSFRPRLDQGKLPLPPMVCVTVATLGFDGCRIDLLDQKNDSSVVAFGDLDPVACLPDEVRDINDRQRVSAMNCQNVAGRYRRERFACLERGYRASETGEIKLDCRHVLKPTTDRRSQGTRRCLQARR